MSAPLYLGGGRVEGTRLTGLDVDQLPPLGIASFFLGRTVEIGGGRGPST
jgi:hypothetical protein